MIWYFLAGMIAGAVGMMMFSGWYMERHATVIHLHLPEDEDKEKTEEKSDD